jgi:hypothetical protein
VKHISKYEVQWTQLQNATWHNPSSAAVTELRHTTPAVPVGAAYMFRVRAYASGWVSGAWTEFSPTSAPMVRVAPRRQPP